MSGLVTCGHCYRLFLPRDREGFCPDCLPGYIRLQSECSFLFDAAESMAHALDQLRGYTGRRDQVIETPSDKE
jgi:hypothetical protein